MTARRDPYRRARAGLVARLKQLGIRDPRVLQAIGQTPRELFVPTPLRDQAYEDVRLPIGEGQTISRPWMVARMCELLAAPAGSRVLEVGAGSGYHAAVLAAMGVIVFAVERHASLAREAADRLRRLGCLNASVKHFDGTYGWAAWAPYRGILVTAAAPAPPAALLQQLDDGGRLVLPLVRGTQQRLVVIGKLGRRWTEEDHGPADFVPLIGKFGFEAAPSP